MIQSTIYKLQLKNMVSKSCIHLIKLVLQKYEEITIDYVRLGEVQLQVNTDIISFEDIDKIFINIGLPPLKTRDEQIIEGIKQAAIELIYYASNANSLIRNSDHISERVGLPYTTLSKIFSEFTSTTLEKYIILLKIERVKEMIAQEEFTVSEIAYMMEYSSVQYLSTQFKKITGYSVSEYKKLKVKPRVPLEDLI